MKKEIVITDLTRMQHGKVCIAGYDADQHCIRPVPPPPGIDQQFIVENGKPIAYPFAVVELDLLMRKPQPPHTEDYTYDPSSLRFLRQVAEKKRPDILSWSLCKQVGDIFGQPVLHGPGHYVLDGQGTHSLGTVCPQSIEYVIYEEGENGAWDYRLSFTDTANRYRLKIVDLTWHYYCDCLRSQGREPAEVAVALTEMLKGRTVFLRIGLSRGWAKFPGRCYLQITGIHTLPDYLEGRTYIDLRC